MGNLFANNWNMYTTTPDFSSEPLIDVYKSARGFSY